MDGLGIFLIRGKKMLNRIIRGFNFNRETIIGKVIDKIQINNDTVYLCLINTEQEQLPNIDYIQASEVSYLYPEYNEVENIRGKL